MGEHILIVEDDGSVAEGLSDILTGYEYAVSLAGTARDALALLQREVFDLILLDVVLGPDSGFALCRQIRERTQAPVLFLTACSSEMELVRGFQMGGDDYVTKPFRMQELLVRIQALLRRAKRQERPSLRSGGLLYEPEQRRLSRAGTALELTATEWRLACALLERWPQAVSREALLYEVWDKNADFVEANTLSVNISRLREKLGGWDGTPYVETVRGVGYRWSVPVSR